MAAESTIMDVAQYNAVLGDNPNIFYSTKSSTESNSDYVQSGTVVVSGKPLSSGVGTILRVTVNLDLGSVEFYD